MYDFPIFQVPDHVLNQIAMCNSQMNYEDGELLAKIVKLSEIVANTSFISQVLSINDEICTLSADN